MTEDQELESMSSDARLARSPSTSRAGSGTVVQKCGLALGAVVVALAICEVAARLVFPAPPDTTREPRLLYARDPELGYFHVPNQAGWVDDGLATINALGFRGGELMSPKPKGLFRVGVVGDSLSFGWGVNDDETYGAQLEQRLRGRFAGVELEVVNCGVSGYATNQEAALLERFAPRLQFDLVLIGFYWNDLLMQKSDPSRKKVSTADSMSRILAPDAKGGQLLRMNPSPSWLGARLRWSRAIYCAGRGLRGLLSPREGGRRYVSLETMLLEGQPSAVVSEGWGQVRGELLRIRALSKSYGFAVAIAVLPSRIQASKEYPNAQYQNKVQQMSEELGFLWIDPLPRFLSRRSEVDQLYIPYDMHHPSAKGHRLIADAIGEAFERRPELFGRGTSARGSAVPAGAEGARTARLNERVDH